MVLSYALRVCCIGILSVGLLMCFAELLLWATAPLLLTAVNSLPMRQRERMLYLIQLAPNLFALLGTAFGTLPQYLKNETNPAPEGVSLLCLALTMTICGWLAWSLLRGLHSLIQTAKFSRACTRASIAQPWSFQGTTIMALPSNGHHVALVGIVRPFIVLSRDWLLPSAMAPEALQVVLAHERAHAAQYDNWKLFSLRLIPRLTLPHRSGRSWLQLWQSSAEWAADDDAAQMDRQRGQLLAEALLLASRSVVNRSSVIQTFLTCQEAELAARVRRLIDGSTSQPTRPAHRNLLALVVTATLGSIAVISLLWLMPSLRALPEHLLHLG